MARLLSTADLAALGYGTPQASRILRAAERGLQPITDVMETPPTFSEGAASAASTITGNTLAAAAYPITHPAITWIGVFAAATSRDEMVSYIGAGSRRVGHGWGFKFATDAAQFDIAFGTGGALPFILYVTDLTAGVRARASANDYVRSVTAANYTKWVFPDARARLIEFYGDYSGATVMPIYGINVPTSAAIWRYREADDPRIGCIWDSWGDRGGSANTNVVKLLAPDFMGEALGCKNVRSLSQGGSGFVNPAGSGSTLKGNYYQRIANGDIDPARVGELDLIDFNGTLNDDAANGAGYTDADVQAAVARTIALTMAKQPRAIITCSGPEQTKAYTAAQARFDAMKAGLLAAAQGDPRVIWLDNSPAGENWLFGTATTGNISTYFGADLNHLNDFGQATWGRRRARSIVDGIRKSFAL